MTQSFAQKYPFYLSIETARFLLAVSRQRRLDRQLARSMRESSEKVRRERVYIKGVDVTDELDKMNAQIFNFGLSAPWLKTPIRVTRTVVEQREYDQYRDTDFSESEIPLTWTPRTYRK